MQHTSIAEGLGVIEAETLMEGLPSATDLEAWGVPPLNRHRVGSSLDIDL